MGEVGFVIDVYFFCFLERGRGRRFCVRRYFMGEGGGVGGIFLISVGFC